MGKWRIRGPVILVASCVLVFVGAIFLLVSNTGNSSWGPADCDNKDHANPVKMDHVPFQISKPFIEIL